MKSRPNILQALDSIGSPLILQVFWPSLVVSWAGCAQSEAQCAQKADLCTWSTVARGSTWFAALMSDLRRVVLHHNSKPNSNDQNQSFKKDRSEYLTFNKLNIENHFNPTRFGLPIWSKNERGMYLGLERGFGSEITQQMREIAIIKGVGSARNPTRVRQPDPGSTPQPDPGLTARPGFTLNPFLFPDGTRPGPHNSIRVSA
ncbi:hypothetical protein L2E82_27645 [Cichorium intybus]|uniref:Uncharacterized protein n=1 Tax=Cichorium intybus TaxID=13427 RepID=A0ACB9CTT3_CICIN|nr:hypothetical protein L2E82_27645 [Cichorium intybus]